MLSQILMVIALVVLAYMVLITINSNGRRKYKRTDDSETECNQNEDFKNNKLSPLAETFANGKEDNDNNARMIINEQPVGNQIMIEPKNLNEYSKPLTFPPANKNAPVNNTNINEIDYATVPTNFVGSKPSGETNEDVNEVYKVDGTDLLAAPLADRFYYTNSIANVNRNATHDFRGDIPISYNDNYTPFYQSAIYGEPLTVNRLGDHN